MSDLRILTYPVTDYYTQSQTNNLISVTSGNIVAQIPSSANFATTSQLTTTSANIVSQIPSSANFATVAQLTSTSGSIISFINTVSGNIVSQIISPAGYATLTYLNTVSGNIVSQIPSLAGYATQGWVTSQGYATQAWVSGQLSGYATQSWVTGQNYATLSFLNTVSGNLVSQIITGGITFSGINNIVTTISGGVWYVSQNLSASDIRFNPTPYSYFAYVADGTTNTGTAYATPAMTSNTTPTPYVTSASTVGYGWPAWWAFDQNGQSDGWHSAQYLPQWLKFDYVLTRVLINKYRIMQRAGTHIPANWTFEGSLDNSAWTILHTVSGAHYGGDYWSDWYSFTNATPYRCYRINVSASSSTWVNIFEVQMVAAVSGTGTTPSLIYPASGINTVQDGMDCMGAILTNYVLASGSYVTQPWVTAQEYLNLTGLTTTSGDIVSWVNNQSYATLSYLNVVSGNIVSQIPSLSSYATQTWVINQNYATSANLTVTSGNILSYVSNNCPTFSYLTTVSANLVSQMPNAITLQGTGGVGVSRASNTWYIDGSGISGGPGQTGATSSTTSGVAGELLVKNDVVYQSISDGKLYKAFNNGLAYQADAIGLVSSDVTVSGNMAQITAEGLVSNAGWSWTAGADLYVSSTSGVLTPNVPTTSGYIAKPMGQARSATDVFVRPELGWQVDNIYSTVIITGQQGPTGAASTIPGPQGQQGIPGPQVTYISIFGTAGETLSQYDVVYQDYNNGGVFKKAVCSDLNKADASGLVLQAGGVTSGSTGEIALWGLITYSGWNWSPGKGLFLSSTSGTFTQIQPTTSGYYVKPLGRTPTSSGVWFNEQLGWLIN